MVMPHVHQFEMHPRLLQRDLLEFCDHHRIQIQAYSSLGEGRLISLIPPPPPAMDAHYNAAPMPGALDIMADLIRKYIDPHFEEVEGPVVDGDDKRKAEYSKAAAQILLRWGLQHGAVVIPKSTHPERIRNNIDLFSFAIDAAVGGFMSLYLDNVTADVLTLFTFYNCPVQDMSALDTYSVDGERTRYCWDPTEVC
ncbi:hypothetical protein BGX28_005862 [Mortierella sp. GBA30]|nr:hypothetical protein BGX28_005862 [Mortierella sp. GBA30]